MLFIKLLKRSLSALFISMFALMMMGCQKSIPASKPIIPASLLVPCPQLPELSSVDSKARLKWEISIINQYNECALKDLSLINAVK